MYNIYFYILILVVIFIIIYFNFRQKQLFKNIIVGNEFDNTNYDIITFINTNTKDIFIGDYKDNEIKNIQNFFKTGTPINIKGNLYVRDKINIGGTIIEIEDLIRIKGKSYMFDKEICLKEESGSSISCIKQEHIEMLNGNRAMVINTFPEVYPFTFYKDINYGSTLYRTVFKEYKDLITPFKSVRILDGYRLKIYPKKNLEGKYKILESDEPNIPGLGEEWGEGIQSFIPETDFGSDNISDRMCMTATKFGPWQQTIDGPRDIYTNIFRGEPCLFKDDQEFVIKKKKLYYNSQNNIKIHRHKLSDVHEDINIDLNT